MAFSHSAYRLAEMQWCS
ncbi:hypothetical protein MTQ42_05865, partial [Escherichia coli]|nr:hypothetical protein [Escherichia coli]